jgi:hypothetical protein
VPERGRRVPQQHRLQLRQRRRQLPGGRHVPGVPLPRRPVPDANCQCADAGGYEPGRPPAPPVAGIDELCSLTPIGASLLATTAGGNQTLFVSDMERGPGF